MKNVLLLLLSLLPFAGMANAVKDISLLEKNDWVQFEVTGYNPSSFPGVETNAPWMVENVRKVLFKVTVLDRKKELLTLGVTIVRITDQVVNSKEGGFFYYDSWYEKDYSTKDNPYEGFQPATPKENVVTQIPAENYLQLTFNLNGNGELQVYNRNSIKEQLFFYPCRYILNGIYSNDGGWKNGRIFRGYKITQEPADALQSYINQWIKLSREKQTLPYSVLLSGTTLPSEIRVVDASFPLPSNVRLTYNHFDKQLKEQRKETCNFFTSVPLKYDFAGKKWLVLPGDSLVLDEDESGNGNYSGIGADKNNAYQELCLKASLQSNYSFIDGTSPEVINNYLMAWNTTYSAIITKYADTLDPFWKMSFELSSKYHQAYVRTFAGSLQLVNGRDTKGLVDWSLDVFSTLSPFTDYQYLPLNYTSFMNAFVGYKVTQFTNDNLTGSLNFWGNNLDQYYLQNQILSGYPKYAVNAEVLDELMREMPLSDIRREYQEFTDHCPDTALVNEVKATHAFFSKIEPGALIQKVGLSLAKEFPMKGKERNSYILFSISLPVPDENSEVLKFLEGVKTAKLSDNVSLQFYRSESMSSLIPDSLKSNFRLIPDTELKENLLKVSTGIGVTLLIRGDGTILYRSFDPFDWYSPEIIEIIKHDMNRKEPATAGSSFLLGVLVMFCLAGGVGVILYIRVKIRQKKERTRRLFTELELKALRSQMNPHFIFNALNSIQNLINRSELELANRYLLNFAKLLRMVLSASEKKLITLSEEMELLCLYLSLEQLRMPFQFSIEKEDLLEPEIIEIPGMLIQPLVENAVKHAIVPNRGGHIAIRFSMKDSALMIEVEDDGPGMDASESTHATGFGLKAVKERLKLLQEQSQTKASFSISNRKGDGISGCIVTLIIPVE